MSMFVDICGDPHKGETFDDGVYDGISKVTIGDHETYGVVYMKIEYIKDGDVVEKQHGNMRGEEITELVFAVDHPDEYITELFAFHLGADGKKFAGLHGRAGDVIHALGGHFDMVSSAHTPMPSVPKGGNYGTTWDDGAYDEGVKKLWVGESDRHLSYIKFQYCNGDILVPSASQVGGFDCIKNLIFHSHGKEPPEAPKEIELDDDDYVTSMEVGMSNYYGFLSIAMLKIKTNRGGAQVLGYDPTGSVKYAKRLLFKKRGHKIVGFFGRTSDFLEDIGVYFEPINDE
ncbi:hypothetical protein CARUB_v10024908mg [Capsella rubella]|uniref:Jacalin-type lectin domain-containing protein n=1 Tax=Capsella rubella TaxID=81985 RepID=R0HX71_9BRAS|nr:hypothetical protein CARUB_v10024908mg [Capsella rubella]